MNYTIESVGPVRELPAKGNYGPSKIYSVKFKEDPNWSDVFRSADKPAPQLGEQLEGSIEKTQYGYSFRKTKTPFTPRGSGPSNRQVALTAAAHVSDSIASTLEGAERLLKWLELSDAISVATTSYTASHAASSVSDSNLDQPPIENYEDLGL